MYYHPTTLATVHLPSSSNLSAATTDNCRSREGSYPEHSATFSTSSTNPLLLHAECHLLRNEQSLTANDPRNDFQCYTNFNITQGAEYTGGWMSSSIDVQGSEAPGSTKMSLSSSIAFPFSVSPGWTSSDLISDAAETDNQTTMSESMDFEGSSETQEGLSFWTVDSKIVGVKHYQCECGKITKNKGDMRRHRQGLKHSGRSYSCPCGGSYTRKDSLKRHAQMCSYATGI